MQNILLPVDFSPITKNAAVYATRLACDLRARKLILYNVYQAPVIAEPAMPALQIIDFDELRKISLQGLEQLKDELQLLCPEDFVIETVSEFGMLDAGINDMCKQCSADIIVMGIAGGSDMEEVLIGSAATHVAHETAVPVVIVPQNAVYRQIKEVVVACDFKKVDVTMPVGEIKKIMADTKANLHIVHVDEKKRDGENLMVEKAKLEAMFADNSPRINFIHNDDFVAGINAFAAEVVADIIILIVKRHSFFEGLFKRSHTKHLAFHTTIPLLCIHEKTF